MLNLEIRIEDFYAYLIELAFSILFLVLFASIHYNINKSNKVKSLLTEKKWFKFIYFFIFGALLSLLTFVVSTLTSKALDVTIGLPATILCLIFSMSYFYSSSIQIGAIIPTIFWVLYQYKGFSEMTINCGIRLGIVCLFGLIGFAIGFFKEKRWLILILGEIVFAGTYLLTLLLIEDPEWIIQIIEVLTGIISSILFFALIKAINKMFSNVSSISRKAVFIDEHYLVPSLVEESFKQFVKNNNNKQILVCSLEVFGLSNKKLKEKVSEEIYKKLQEKKTFFFKTWEDKYGFIVADDQYFVSNLSLSFKGNSFKERIPDDNLSKFQNKIQSISKQYLINGKQYNINFKCYVSIYGIHSNDINELLWFNQFMITNDDSKEGNCIKLFNSNMVNHITNDRVHYATLIQRINLDEINVELEKIKIKGQRETYICPRYYWTRRMTCDIKEIMSQFDKQTADTLLRSLAIRSIELYEKSAYKGKTKLLIYYPINELRSRFFSVNTLIKKIQLLGLNKKDIIFSFGCSEILTWPYSIIKNLQEFETNNVSYMLIDVVKTNVLKTLKPKIVIISPQASKSRKNKSKTLVAAKKNKINVLFAS